MRELVPLALMLQRLAGGPERALAWTDTIASKGRHALPLLGLRGDAKLVVADRARTAGVFAADGTVDRVRLAQLVIVLDILAAVPRDPAAEPDAEPLVFTVPRAASGSSRHGSVLTCWSMMSSPGLSQACTSADLSGMKGDGTCCARSYCPPSSTGA